VSICLIMFVSGVVGLDDCQDLVTDVDFTLAREV
jgi:hypothetical protein